MREQQPVPEYPRDTLHGLIEEALRLPDAVVTTHDTGERRIPVAKTICVQDKNGALVVATQDFATQEHHIRFYTSFPRVEDPRDDHTAFWDVQLRPEETLITRTPTKSGKHSPLHISDPSLIRETLVMGCESLDGALEATRPQRAAGKRTWLGGLAIRLFGTRRK